MSYPTYEEVKKRGFLAFHEYRIERNKLINKSKNKKRFVKSNVAIIGYIDGFKEVER